MKGWILGSWIACLSSVTAWSTTAWVAEAAPPPDVYASFYPIEFFAKEIAGELLEVRSPVPADEDPAHWRPDRDVVAALQEAPLVLVHGAGFEHWLDYVSLPLATTRVTTRSFLDRLEPFAAGVDHTHGTEALGAAPELDPHTWLAPDLAEAEARAVFDALVRRFPQHTAAFEARLTALLPRFEFWRVSLAEVAPLVQGELLVASHPSYEYLAREQGWRVENLVLERDEAPSEESLAQLRSFVNAGARYVLWEGPPSQEVEAMLRALGLGAVIYSPGEALSAARRGNGEDFFGVMERNVANLSAALRRTE